MPTWDNLAEAANASLTAVFGETVSYSRPGNGTLDPIAAFDLTAIPHLGAQFEGRNSPTHALQVAIAEISGGPQRGDLITWQRVEYAVHTIDPPVAPYPDGTALLGIRRT